MKLKDILLEKEEKDSNRVTEADLILPRVKKIILQA